MRWRAPWSPRSIWFVYSFVRKEAVLSSQIEGTQATLVDLLAYEALGKMDRTGGTGVGSVRRLLKTTKPTAAKAVSTLVNLGVLAETTRPKRDRSFTYRAYVDRLRTGTELEGPWR